jgi:hypothetical protein
MVLFNRTNMIHMTTSVSQKLNIHVLCTLYICQDYIVLIIILFVLLYVRVGIYSRVKARA